MTVEPLGDVFERDEKDCPHFGGVCIEPRSSDKWNCSTCARQFTAEEMNE